MKFRTQRIALKPFFHWIEKLETPFMIEDAERILGSEAKKGVTLI
ncbi:MAG: hypothetical protein QMC77_08735 [Methanocellales archaeon]|nr:hypothetical protein [Methanocellales archaeon]